MLVPEPVPVTVVVPVREGVGIAVGDSEGTNSTMRVGEREDVTVTVPVCVADQLMVAVRVPLDGVRVAVSDLDEELLGLVLRELRLGLGVKVSDLELEKLREEVQEDD